MINNSYPLNDQNMYWDMQEHMYVLTADYVKAKTGVDLYLLMNDSYIVDKTVAVRRVLEKVSRQVVEEIYSYNVDNDYQEYLMAKSEMAREVLMGALLLQVEYIVRNGKINEFVGVNVSYTQKNANLENEAFRGERAVHPEAVQMLKRRLEDGQSLLSTADYRVPYGIKYRTNY